jgi:sugar (pentulose or hexulose) kinase
VKADITGCTLELPGVPEASLLGAALAAGIGSQVFRDAEEAVAVVTQHNQTQWTTIVPNPESHEQYQKLYTMGFEPLQDPLRHYFKRVSLNL